MSEESNPSVAELAGRVSAIEAALEVRVRKSASDSPFWMIEGIREHAQGAGEVHYAGIYEPEGLAPVEWQYGLNVQALQDLDWARLASGMVALGHPVRLEILRAVLAQPRTVSDLLDLVDAGTTGKIYHHVNKLSAEGWLIQVRRGEYMVPPTRTIPLLALITVLATPRT